MKSDTKEKLEAAITACATKAEKSNNAVEALQFTQAAVNAANALNCVIGIERINK